MYKGPSGLARTVSENPRKNLVAVWEQAIEKAREYERTHHPRGEDETNESSTSTKEPDDVHIEQPDDVEEEIIHVQVVSGRIYYFFTSSCTWSTASVLTIFDRTKVVELLHHGRTRRAASYNMRDGSNDDFLVFRSAYLLERP